MNDTIAKRLKEWLDCFTDQYAQLCEMEANLYEMLDELDSDSDEFSVIRKKIDINVSDIDDGTLWITAGITQIIDKLNGSAENKALQKKEE